MIGQLSAIFRTTHSLPSANAITRSTNLRIGNNKTSSLVVVFPILTYEVHGFACMHKSNQF